MQGWHGQGAHRHLLVGFHAIQHHLDDLPAQLDALLGAVLGIGQVEERSTARDLDVLVVLVALEGCDDQLWESRVGLGWPVLFKPCQARPRSLPGGWDSCSGAQLTLILFPESRSAGWGAEARRGHRSGVRSVLGQARPGARG